MDFDSQKKKQLKMHDASFKGSVDARIQGLIDKVNGLEDYYTTSSCSGRIILLKDGSKKPGLIAFSSHEKMGLDGLKNALEGIDKKGMIWFKQRPCILHVACRDLACAQKLLDVAKASGWKRSGIVASSNRFVCELWSTEEIAFPIWEDKLLVDDGFLEITLERANANLKKSWEKIDGLQRVLV